MKLLLSVEVKSDRYVEQELVNLLVLPEGLFMKS